MSNLSESHYRQNVKIVSVIPKESSKKHFSNNVERQLSSKVVKGSNSLAKVITSPPTFSTRIVTTKVNVISEPKTNVVSNGRSNVLNSKLNSFTRPKINDESKPKQRIIPINVSKSKVTFANSNADSNSKDNAFSNATSVPSSKVTYAQSPNVMSAPNPKVTSGKSLKLASLPNPKAISAQRSKVMSVTNPKVMSASSPTVRSIASSKVASLSNPRVTSVRSVNDNVNSKVTTKGNTFASPKGNLTARARVNACTKVDSLSTPKVIEIHECNCEMHENDINPMYTKLMNIISNSSNNDKSKLNQRKNPNVAIHNNNKECNNTKGNNGIVKTPNVRISNQKSKINERMNRESFAGGKFCKFCNRKFELNDRLQKHESICERITKKERKPFDSVDQRFKGKPNEYVQSYEHSLRETHPKPKSNWRKKHEYFIAMVREAKGQNGGRTTAEITASMLELCDYCGRRFKKEALERHIPICAKLTEKNKFHNNVKRHSKNTY